MILKLKSIGIKIIQINIEGLTGTKSGMSNKVYSKVNVLAIQEINDSKEEVKIHSFQLINYIDQKSMV